MKVIPYVITNRYDDHILSYKDNCIFLYFSENYLKEKEEVNRIMFKKEYGYFTTITYINGKPNKIMHNGAVVYNTIKNICNELNKRLNDSNDPIGEFYAVVKK